MARPDPVHVAGPPLRDVAARERIGAPEAVDDRLRIVGAGPVHACELSAHDDVSIALREREQVREALGRDERGQDAFALRPRRTEKMLSFAEAVRADVHPD